MEEGGGGIRKRGGILRKCRKKREGRVQKKRPEYRKREGEGKQ